jgi:hypothetical protein
MNLLKNRLWIAASCWLVLGLACFQTASAVATEQTFDVLQIGTKSYTNVTVTTRSTAYVFLLHAGGLVNIKVADLPYEAKIKLGYLAETNRAPNDVAAHTLDPSDISSPPASAAFDLHHPLVWLRQKFADLDNVQNPRLQRLFENLRLEQTEGATRLRHPDVTVVSALIGALVIAHIFFSYCFMLICRKVSQPGGVLVWIPILQIYPLFHAAGMSGWWSLTCFMPGLNFLAFIIWSFRIARARGKSALVGLFLLFPLLNFLSLLYLAFSDGEQAAEVERPRKEVMTLETA